MYKQLAKESKRYRKLYLKEKKALRSLMHNFTTGLKIPKNVISKYKENKNTENHLQDNILIAEKFTNPNIINENYMCFLGWVDG